MVESVNYRPDIRVAAAIGCVVPSTEPIGCGALPAGFQPAALPAEGEVFLQLMAIGEGLRQHIADVAARFDFTPQQALLVERLSSPRTMGQIAEALGCDKSNVTGLISRLETRGLVARTPDEHDRRIKWLTLTGDGEAVRLMLREQILQGQAILSGFTDEERDGFLGYLRRASASLTAPAPDRSCGGAVRMGTGDGSLARDLAEARCCAADPIDSGLAGH